MDSDKLSTTTFGASTVAGESPPHACKQAKVKTDNRVKIDFAIVALSYLTRLRIDSGAAVFTDGFAGRVCLVAASALQQQPLVTTA
jgi:hypothetical protein